MDSTKQNRIFYYDMIRFFAIFGILSCHIFASLVVKPQIFATKLWYYSVLMNSLRDVSIGLFVALSGALLIKKKDSLIVFFKKRLSRVILPYVFWVIVFIIFGIICITKGYYFKCSISELIINTASISPTGPGNFFWFVPMIIVVYIVIAILNRLYTYNNDSLKYALCISLFVVIIWNVFNLHITNPYKYVFYSVFAVIGYYCANIDLTDISIVKDFRISNGKLALLFFALSIVLYALEIYFNVSTSMDLGKYRYVSQFSLVNVALVVSTFLFFRYFSESKGRIYSAIENSAAGKIIFSISICSYGIYLSHMIVKLSLEYFLYPFKASLPISIYTTFLLILTLLISWIIILLLGKIPVIEKFSGK